MSHSTCRLVIFVSCLSIDALCASKILTGLLKKELIQYQLVPVVGYTDLKKHYDKLDMDVTNVVLLGCGASIDLEGFFEIDPEEFKIEDDEFDASTFKEDPEVKYSRKIYVIDGHKPWNLDNIFGSEMVVCFDDGYIEQRLQAEKKAYTLVGELQSQQEEEEDSDSEDGSDSEDEELQETDKDSDEDDDEEDSKKRKRSREQKAHKKQLRENSKILEDYYSTGTTISVSVSLLVYTLISEIGETSIENLWLNIIGTISLDTQYPDVYKASFQALKGESIRLNPTVIDGSSSKNADSSLLTIDTDYYLFLLRHWTLYDSFFYSNFVNAKLGVWKEEGRKRLHKMFARMGISLQDSKQNWLYMNSDIKQNLNSTFKNTLGYFGLEDLTREGFVRTFGFRGSISAGECVESIAALLEHDNLQLQQNENNINNNSNINDSNDNNTNDNENNDRNKENNDNQNEVEEEEDTNAIISKREKVWINNFWCTWDALNNQNIDLISKGLEYAKDFQKLIFNTGMEIFEKRLLRNFKIYRLVVLKDGPNIDTFKNPLILTRLGNWLLESCAEIDKTLLPLVLAALDEKTDTYLVIGLAPHYPRGTNDLTNFDNSTTLLNTFSVAFQQVADLTGAKVKIDSFESSIMVIKKDDLQPFLERLTLSGLI